MLKIYINKQPLPFQAKRFAGGEEHVILTATSAIAEAQNLAPVHLSIFALIQSSSELMQLLLLVDALKQQFKNIASFELELPYIPYARQDRICNAGEAFSLKIFCQLINQCGFSAVYVDDPHSDVAPALLDRCVIRPQHEILVAHCQTEPSFNAFVEQAQLVSPDAGSNKKMLAVCQALHKNSFIRADKIRDVATGKISETIVYSDVISGKVLIVDDICDGGRTFTTLAQQLKAKGAEQVGLYVTHGIFAHGKAPLVEAGIDAIFARYDWSTL